MIDVLIWPFLISIAAILYVYAGYITMLQLVVRIKGDRPIRSQPITPSVTLLISAYNEAAVIRKKLENALSIDYPSHLLAIVVVSDASDDGTDEIVREYADRNVRLFRQAERRGKTAGLNAAIATVRSDVVVFSDANAMYSRNAIRMLVRNFADGDIGCVTGEAQYLPQGDAVADVGERLYWGYEMQIKRLETSIGSMVGGDGAIYAIRTALWRTLPDNAINDFLNPLQIVAAGWRATYEPMAICSEETAGDTRVEYKRRVRIVSRSWRAVLHTPQVLNPFRVGLFAWCVLSHKVLRWFSGFFAAVALVCALEMSFEVVQRWPVAGAVVLLAAAAALLVSPVRRSSAMLWYFAVINAASVVGVVKGTFGQVSGVWSTARAVPTAPARGLVVPTGLVLLLGILAMSVVAVTAVPFGVYSTSTVVFWGSTAALGYVYIGYPAVLALLRAVIRKPIVKAATEPRVCLLIAANDEEAVIDAKLRNSLAVDYPHERFEIVVASDGSIDDTNAMVKRFAPRVRLLELSPRRGKIAAINEAMRSITAEIVIFSDANTFLDPQAVRELVQNFADPRVGAASGDVSLVGDRAALARSEDLYYLYERWVQQAESEIGSMIGADGALYAIRRELFVPPGNDTILDDMAIPMAVVRAGRRVVFEPTARGYEQGSETAAEEFARKSRVVAGAIQFLARRDSWIGMRSVQAIFSLVSHKGLRWLSPAFLTGAFVASLLLADVAPVYAAAATAQGLVFGLGLFGCWRPLRRLGIIALAHYFCLVQLAACVGFVRGVSGAQSVLWQRFQRATDPEPMVAHD
ncbi:MAG: glycosyltransferase family 2 protein [Acidobacteria bacterium]|nr:glycosyltransferase family 2 protein [Acidobacteriota bacterium]